MGYTFSIWFIWQLSNLYLVFANAKSKLNGWQRRGRGQQSNLTHCGCEQCVYMPKLVVCKWVWYRLTAPENSSHSGHMHFPEGSPRRHQDIFMIHPLAKPPPHPPSLQSYWQLGLEHMLLLQLFRKRCLGNSAFSGRRKWGITPSEHVLEKFNTGALISRMAERLQRSTREVRHLLGRNV